MKILFVILFLFSNHVLWAQEYLKKGDDCYNQKNYTCAYDNYMKGYELNLPATKNVLYFRIGYCLNSMRRYEEGKVWLRRSLNEKISLEATWALAHSHYSTYKNDSAAIYYVRAYGLATTNEDKKNTSYYAGLSYYLNKNYYDANIQFQNCWKLDSTDINTNGSLGRNYYALKNYTAAESSFRRLLSLSKDSVSISYAYKMIGESNYAQKKYTDAIALYKNAIVYNSRDKYLVSYLGDAYLGLKKTDSANFFFQQSIDMVKAQKKPILDDSIFIADVSIGILNAFLAQKDTSNGLRILTDIVRYDVGNEKLTGLLNLLVIKRKDIKSLESIAPSLIAGYRQWNMKLELAWLYNNIAMLYEELKQQPKAMNNYRLAVQANYPPTDYIGTGFIRSLIKEKKYKEATDSINKWETITHQYPNLFKPFLINMKGRIAYAQNDTVTASRYFKEAIKANFTSHDGNLFLGKMAIDRKDSASCFNYWSRIGNLINFGIETDWAAAVYKFVGIRNFELAVKNPSYGYNSYTKASEAFDKVLALDSNQAVIRLYAGVTHLQLKRIYTGKSHLIKAAELYQKKKDSLATVYRWLGFAELRGETLPNYTKAYDYYQKGIQANPSDSFIVVDLATAYYQQKNYAKAAESFGKVIAIQKGTADKAIAYYNRALSYYMNKQKEEAIVDVNKSLELNPQYADAKKLKTQLEKPTQ